MFKLSSEFKERYYNFIYKYFNLEKHIKLLPVDFNKPWFQILLDQKWNLVLQILSEMVQSIFSALTPVILGLAIFNNKPEYLYYFAIGFASLELMNRTLIRYFTILILQSSNSIEFSAYKYFLTVDPIYHSTKSSGQIISKIQKTGSDLEQLISLFVESFLNTVIGYITVIVALSSFDYRLGIICTVSFVLVTLASGGLNYINAIIFRKRMIQADDKATSESVETLQQNALVRASFASNEQVYKLGKSIKHAMDMTSVARQTFGVTRTITRITFAVSCLLIGLVILNLIQNGEMNAGIGLSLLLAYFNGSGPVLGVGNMIRNIITYTSRQEDLFDFIRQFGVQTYPVLEGNKIDINVALQIQQLEEKQKEYLDGKK
jgi:ABC-type multidrug transport system fused ATPase/permease subunit